MKILVYIFILLSIATFNVNSQAIPKKVVCYWRDFIGFNKLNALLCTHMIFTFIGVNKTGNVVTYNQPDFLAMSNYFKGQNPSIKLLASMAADNWDGSIYSLIAGSSCLRDMLASNALQFLQTHNLDGIDVNWAFPSPNDANNYVLLLTTLRNQLNPNGFLLTIGVYSFGPSYASPAYKIPQIIALVDFINLFIFEFHYGGESTTNYMTPLYSNDALSIAAVVKYWLSGGAPNNMLIVGILLYGQKWTLANPNNNGLGAATISNQGGTLTYSEICQGIKSQKYISKFDPARGATYAYGGNQWISYIDYQAIDAILSYIIAFNLGGIMFCPLDNDDGNNVCGDGAFPIVTRAYTTLTVYCGNNGYCNKVGFKNIGTYQGVDNFNVAYRKSYHIPVHYGSYNWLQAAEICTEFNMSLATFRTFNEYNVVKGFLFQNWNLLSDWLWIGGVANTGKSTTDWFWFGLNQKINYPIPWLAGNPDFYNSTEWCLSLGAKSMNSMNFNDANCDTMNTMYICDQLV